MERIDIKTSSRFEMVDITNEVRSAVKRSGKKEGICVLYVPHTTAALTVNEGADPSVKEDILMELDRNIPLDDGYSHLEGNAAAHIKSALMGPSLTLIIEEGDIVLGTWQSIFFCEFDGPRSRKVFLKILG